MNHSSQICQKIACAFFITLSLMFCSCTQSIDLRVPSPEETPVSLKSGSIAMTDYICNPRSTFLIVRQKYHVGVVNLSVNPCNGNILVSINTEEGWVLKNIYIFIGARELLQIDQYGNPQVENFPMKYNLLPYQTTFSGECYNTGINLGDSPSYTVVIFAEMSKLDKNGRVIKSEEAWIEGTRFAKNISWATYFDYPLMACGPCPP